VTTTRLDLEYVGTRFAGWTRQPGLRTVQGELEEGLGVLLRRPVELTVAGRTDRGVHAWGQVASYQGEPVDPAAINALIGPDVAVRAARSMPAGFDARRDALSRTYCYRILHRRERSAFERGHALWWRHRLDRDLLHACAAALAGRHDFTAFTPKETDHVRFHRDVAGARWEDRGDILEFWIEADSFLRHMNRTLVGTMLQVAGGRRSHEAFVALLEGRPRAEAGPTAGAHGLHLAAVAYPGTSGDSRDPIVDTARRVE
jgi:tRNA pseudouridine38-40 synthase